MSRKENQNMNPITEDQNPTSSVDPLVAELQAKFGSFPPTAERMEKSKARKAELEFASMKNRADAKERHREMLKERARRIIRGDTDDE